MGFRGSYSAVWSPVSFWEPQAPLQGRKLRLYLLPSSAQVRPGGEQHLLRQCLRHRWEERTALLLSSLPSVLTMPVQKGRADCQKHPAPTHAVCMRALAEHLTS